MSASHDPSGFTQTGTLVERAPEPSRRQIPRVKLRLPVQLGLSGGRIVDAEMHNLSLQGMQVRCDTATAAAINPSGKAIASGTDDAVLAVLRLESGERAHVVRCEVGYMSPVTKTRVAIGLKFDRLLPEQRAAVERVLAAKA